MELEFTKLSGAGNDFIVIDNLHNHLPEEGRQQLFSQWCRRGLGVGADGVLLVESADTSSAAHFRMRYYNADGGEAETCGNGSRCIARFAFHQGLAPRDMVFQTLAGDYSAQVLEDGNVRVSMSDAFGLKQVATSALVEGTTRDVHFINTGVPHAVIFVDDVSTVPVVEIGPPLRHHAAFAPAGTNVNFVEITGEGQLRVRTYERGVEDETLACGTGCIASAIFAKREHGVSTPVQVTTASDEVLRIDFQPTADGATNVTLQGSANIIYRGYIDINLPVSVATHQSL